MFKSLSYITLLRICMIIFLFKVFLVKVFSLYTFLEEYFSAKTQFILEVFSKNIIKRLKVDSVCKIKFFIKHI